MSQEQTPEAFKNNEQAKHIYGDLSESAQELINRIVSQTDASSSEEVPPVEKVQEDCSKALGILETISLEACAVDIFEYFASSVKNYINTKDTAYVEYLYPVEDETQALLMPNLLKLNQAYTGIPEIPVLDLNDPTMSPQEQIVQDSLDKIHDFVAKLRDVLVNRDQYTAAIKSASEKLFKALSYYYEVIGVTREGLVTQELSGYISVDHFFYDTISTSSISRQKHPVTGEIISEREVYVPAAFVVEFQIVKWKKNKVASIM